MEFLTIKEKNLQVDIKLSFFNIYEFHSFVNEKILRQIFKKFLVLMEEKKIFKGKKYLSILITNNHEIAEINLKSRKKKYPTNVLSFPFLEKFSNTNKGHIDNLSCIGDLVISIEKIKDEAKKEKKLFIDHFIHILVHGLLHLLGYDHEERKEAREMEKIEIDFLNDLDVKNPY